MQTFRGHDNVSIGAFFLADVGRVGGGLSHFSARLCGWLEADKTERGEASFCSSVLEALTDTRVLRAGIWGI